MPILDDIFAAPLVTARGMYDLVAAEAKSISRPFTKNDAKAFSLETSDYPTNVDQSKMCATGLLSTNARDRVLDRVEIGGINLAAHSFNPVSLLDHGLYHALPIGKTEDENGNYTVKKIGDDLIQTTYFSQHSLMAEQVFALICEKMLRGNSIRFENAEYKPLQPRGRHIISCDLVEVTWCALPANQECVTSLLDNNIIAGKAILPELKSMLAPYRLAKKVWSNGMNHEEMSSLDETTGGALREDYGDHKEDNYMDEEKDDMERVEDDPEEEEKEDEPLGSSVLRNMHADMAGMHETYSSHVGKLEQPKVKAHVEKVVGNLEKCMKEIADLHGRTYPESEAINGADAEQDAEEIEQEESDDVDEPEEGEKTLKVLLRKMEAIEKALAPKDEELSPEDKLTLTRLERSIARKEKMLKIGSGR